MAQLKVSGLNLRSIAVILRTSRFLAEMIISNRTFCRPCRRATSRYKSRGFPPNSIRPALLLPELESKNQEFKSALDQSEALNRHRDSYMSVAGHTESVTTSSSRDVKFLSISIISFNHTSPHNPSSENLSTDFLMSLSIERARKIKRLFAESQGNAGASKHFKPSLNFSRIGASRNHTSNLTRQIYRNERSGEKDVGDYIQWLEHWKAGEESTENKA